MSLLANVGVPGSPGLGAPLTDYIFIKVLKQRETIVKLHSIFAWTDACKRERRLVVVFPRAATATAAATIIRLFADNERKVIFN